MFPQILTSLLSFIVAARVTLLRPPHALPAKGATLHESTPLGTTVPPVGLLLAMAAPAAVKRNGRRQRGAIYARHSTKFQTSIDDQVRACREWCEANEVEVAEDMVFVDRAISGKRSRRDGLDRLKAAMAAKQVDVLASFATNRLHRSAYKARQFIEELAIENGVRVVCVRSQVDTANERQWRLLAGVNAMADAMKVGGPAAAARNAHARAPARRAPA